MAQQFNYTFLPWLRQGLAKRIQANDTLGVSDGAGTERASLSVKLTVKGDRLSGSGAVEDSVTKEVLIAGPGDVLGIDPRMILRAQPANGIPNFESNFLAYLEFYEEDFPWRYTPAMPDAAAPHRLRPWLALIVLKHDEFNLQTNAVSGAILSVFPEKAAQVFPDHRETWAWAHVQLARKLDFDPTISQKVQTLLEQDPDLGISRLLCPRRLQPEAEYTAFLIPAFETGRLAGLGEPVAGIPAQKPSWKTGEIYHSDTRPLEYPVYFHWTFNTAQGGDFEKLVRKIRPLTLPPDKPVTLSVDIHDPGLGLQLPDNESLGVIQLESVLQPSGLTTAAFPNAGQKAYQKQLEQLLNLQNAATPSATPGTNPFLNDFIADPVILPPTYGAAHAGASTLSAATPAAATWLRPLNLNPRYRAIAGLGTEAVRQHQEEFMEMAWRQVGEVEEANQRLREAQGMERAAKSLLRKHFMPAKDTGDFLQLTAPLHRRIVVDPATSQTAQAVFSRKPQLASVVNATFQRTLRFAHVAKNNIPLQVDAVRLNLQPYRFPVGQMSELLMMVAANSFSDQVSTKMSALRVRSAFVTLFDRTTLTSLDKTALKAQIPAGLTPNEAATVRSWIDQTSGFTVSVKKETDPLTGMETNTEFRTVRVGTSFWILTNILEPGVSVMRWGRVILAKQGATIPLALPSTILNPEWETYKIGYNDFSGILGTGVIFHEAAGGDLFSNVILQKIEPLRAYKRKVAATVRVLDGSAGTGTPQTSAPGLDLIMAYPEFDLPVYEYLTKQSVSYIFPLLDEVPLNSVGVFEVNRAVIEAFMAGMNTEMGRELLWREYPTDQRGSYFRRFWDPANPAAAGQPDIHPMHTWTKTLGQNHISPTVPTALVIRGELLKKYPQTVVYAHKAKKNGNGPRTLTAETAENMAFPVFSAFIEPDIMLLGFNLTVTQLLGYNPNNTQPTMGTGNNPGYFFVFRERPGQMQFGLDELEPDQPAGPLASWNDLSWQHLSGADQPAGYQIRVDQALTLAGNTSGQARWNSNAAEMAAILLQKPVLMARHTRELLITDHSDLNF